MRWHYRDPWLAWLLPAAYSVHILEEWFGGFTDWVALVLGSPMPRRAFVVINAIAMAAAVIATRASTVREQYGWAGIAVATVLFVNAVAHALGTIVTRVYSPGLISGLVMYLPIAGLLLLRASSQAAGGAFGRGVMIGLGIHVGVFMIAFLSAR